MIVLTGAAGFIGSCLLKKLNDEGHHNIILVDEFESSEKNKNLSGKLFTIKIPRDKFLPWFKQNPEKVEFVFHLGARTDTVETDTGIFDRLNLNYSKQIWQICADNGIPLVYASSAATYGAGESGYDDDEALIPQLKPLNAYGQSKQDFDVWVLEQNKKPPFWAGLKFFNVYGPNEYHKGRMASVIFHACHQIKNTGKVKLFRSHRKDFADGMQLRDFIYVKDVIDICYYFFENQTHPGIYNVGTGKARTFNDLAINVFKSLDLQPDITYIDIPEDIRGNYQYFTQANIDKLKNAGYAQEFWKLEEGVEDYVKNYLVKGKYY